MKHIRQLRRTAAASLVTAVSIGLGMLVGSSPTQAWHSPFVHHVTRPHPEPQTVQRSEQVTVHANIRNDSTTTVTTPVCATAFMGRHTYHLGCIPTLTLRPGESYAFNMTREFPATGNYVITFSYRTPAGHWHEVLSGAHTLNRTHIFVR